MANVKVQHALVSYTDTQPDGRTDQVIRLRGWSGEIPDEVVEDVNRRALAGGGPLALIPADDELAGQSGTVLTPVSSESTDEEIVSFLLAATGSELTTFLAGLDDDERTALQRRFADASDFIIDSRVDAVAAQAAAIAEAGPGDPTGTDGGMSTVNPAADAEGGTVTANTSSTPLGGPDAPQDPAEVVKGSVDEVSAYLSRYPETADAILRAETEARAADGGKEARVGVVRAAEAVAGFSGQ